MAVTATEHIIEIGPQDGPQEDFLSSPADIVIYGGAAGGGKTMGLLLEPIRHIDNPGFGGVIFRRTTKQVVKEGSLWDTSEQFYPLLGAKSNLTNLSWGFPSGAKITFGHLEHEKNKFDWQGSQIAYLGFDELTHFTRTQFFYMLSRNRSTCGIRPYVRATCNPVPPDDPIGGWLHELIGWWIDKRKKLPGGKQNPNYGLPHNDRAGVIRYFVKDGDDLIWGDTKQQVMDQAGHLFEHQALRDANPEDLIKSITFIPSNVYDNPALLKTNPSYLANLLAQDPVDKARLLGGNWMVRATAGMYFRREFFREATACPSGRNTYWYWDFAGTEEKDENKDPDWTVGLKLVAGKHGQWFVARVVRFRQEPGRTEELFVNTMSQEPKSVEVWIEQEPGSSGKSFVHHIASLLPGYAVRGDKVSGDKQVRAKPVSAASSQGFIIIVKGRWNEAFYSELEHFPQGAHDDQVDALSGAYNMANEDPFNQDIQTGFI